jgi:hypothetical protein
LIQSTGGQRAGGLRQKAVYVTPADLENYLDQPATLITTVLNLPNTDVRTLSTSMRTMLTDTNTQAMIPAGERALILQGFGTSIASLASLLYLVDDQSAEDDRVQPVCDVIPLEYAAAEEVADLIEQLLEARQRSSVTRARPVQQENQGISGALTSGDVEAKILTYARNNSLLIMAAPEDMPRIKDLVARLDVDVTEPLRKRAEEIAVTVAEALGHIGVMAVEMFELPDGRLLVNEIAPRTHNSGHYTWGACVTSQFEQHVRAVCGLPLGDPRAMSGAVMVNLIGDLWQAGAPAWRAVMDRPEARLHLYGKDLAAPGRKMGHILLLDDDTDRALASADQLIATLTPT